MIITYLGGSFVKIQFGEIVLAFDPISKDSSLKSSKFGADIVLSSLNHSDMNGVDTVSFGDKKPFVISGPGEYEIRSVFITGFSSTSRYKAEERINTIYMVALEGMRICHLGALSTPDLPKEAEEAIDDVDILFIPIGGQGILDPSAAYKLAITINPKIIIPIHYGDGMGKDALKIFLKEAGENPDPVLKLTLKKKDLEGKDSQVIVLQRE